MSCASTAWASFVVGGVAGALFAIGAAAMILILTYCKAVKG